MQDGKVHHIIIQLYGRNGYEDSPSTSVFHGRQRLICVGCFAHDGACEKADKARWSCEGREACTIGLGRLGRGQLVEQVQGFRVSRTEAPKHSQDA